MRVVYLDHCARLSGAQLALARLLVALGDRVDAHVVTAEDGPLVARLRRDGARVEVLPMAERARGARSAAIGWSGPDLATVAATTAYVARLTRRLRRIRPDIVHTNSLKAALYGGVAARAAGLPLVWQIRDRISPDYLPRPAVRLVRTMARLLPDAVLAHGSTIPTLGRSRGVTFAFVDSADPGCFEVSPEARAPGGGPLRVGMIGTIIPWKGQDVFLRAFARAFPAGDTGAVLVGAPLFGDLGYERGLRSLVAQLGIEERVEFRGFRDDVAAELARLDIAVHASVVPEPFGQVVVEAMAAGLPVVAAGAGGPTTIVTDGVDGLLTPPGDVGALAEALARLGGDGVLRARLGAAARERARAFSPEAAAGAVLQAYRAALLRRSRSSRR